MAKKQKEDFGKSLQESFDRWDYLHENGGIDPSWSDGANLNLVRNHIFYYKSRIEESMEPKDYPEIYYRDVPPEVDRDYMVKADEIKTQAKISYDLYMKDKDYQFICRHLNDFNTKEQKKLCVQNVINYPLSLVYAIEKDDLVSMRRHKNPDAYLSSFTSCRRNMRQVKFNKFRTMMLERKSKEA